MRSHRGGGGRAAVPVAAVAGAWIEAGGRRPTSVEPIRLGDKRAVYRLVDAGPDRETVIAKRSGREALKSEWMIYERVLPLLPLTSARAYALVEESVTAWLFLEDAGDTVCDPRTAGALASRWLGTLHGAAASLDVRRLLPDRGPAHYRRHLGAARTTIALHSDNPALTTEDSRLLWDLVAVLSEIERHWNVVEEVCSAGPLTIAHGDFVKRNLRRQSEDGREALIVLDWECAGAASPAADLEVIGLDRTLAAQYISTIQRFLPTVSEQLVTELARVGVGLRLLAAIDWAAADLECPWPQTGMASLQLYEPSIRAWARSLMLAPVRPEAS